MESTTYKFTDRKISIVGVSVKEGQQLTGVEKSPDLFREGGLLKVLENMKWDVKDIGNITKEELQSEIDAEEAKKVDVKYEIPNIEILGVVNKHLCEKVHKESKEERFVLTLGGDHGVASGSIPGMLKTYPDLKLIWVDAHGDCNTPATSPSANYHGMPAGHVMGWFGKGDVKSFDWLDVQIPSKNVVFIGLRDLDEPEKKLLADHKVKFYTPYDIEDKGGMKFVVDEALAYLEADSNTKSPIHISWDVDGCDPSMIYGTGTKSRVGLNERESHYLLQRVAKTGNLVSLDMVEVNTALETEGDREQYHGDNPLINGSPAICAAIELTISALGFSWR